WRVGDRHRHDALGELGEGQGQGERVVDLAIRAALERRLEALDLPSGQLSLFGEDVGEDWVALDAEALDGPLALRRRRPGDRFRPAGGLGSRKLQDFFVDRKVPRGLRDAWPILVTPGSVVWVTGLRADARFVAGPATRSTIWVGLARDEAAPADG
ncbi:MAG: tRNA lysidine(34) synthetase TilS, partial [Chloroflexales bacterium]|nr:tRNA lysidine(34) synthetase TilS [Chloroflexales bacterium]